jgi:hypothetical protein
MPSRIEGNGGRRVNIVVHDCRAKYRRRATMTSQEQRPTMPSQEQKLKALEYFKDWSNYLLVTTVAALGWVASKDSGLHDWAKPWCVGAFGLSALFAILTLAVIPRVGEQLTDKTASIYDVEPSFKPLWFEWSEISVKLKCVCWPQHVLFMAGVVLFALGCIFPRPSPPTTPWWM